MKKTARGRAREERMMALLRNYLGKKDEIRKKLIMDHTKVVPQGPIFGSVLCNSSCDEVVVVEMQEGCEHFVLVPEDLCIHKLKSKVKVIMYRIDR